MSTIPKFDASAISDIEYDLRGFTDENGNSIDDHGSVPEPSVNAVNQMMKDVQKTFKELGLAEKDAPDSTSFEEISKTMQEIDDDDTFLKMNEMLKAALADLCDGKPSAESLGKLKFRPFMGFFGYVMEEVMSPEASKPDTKSSRSRLRSV